MPTERPTASPKPIHSTAAAAHSAPTDTSPSKPGGAGRGWVTLEGFRDFAPPPAPEPSAEERAAIRRELSDWLDRHDRCEWQEKAWELGDESRHWAEIELWQLIVEREPENARNYLHLLDAWRMTGRPAKALEAALPLLEAEDRCLESEQALVELMVELGRDWRELPWREQPRVRELDDATARVILARLDECGSILVDELWFELGDDAVRLFDIEELTRFLERDARFEIRHDDPFRAAVARAERDGA